MQMFVANTTQQYHQLMYRIPEGQKLIIQSIDPGGQIRISARRGDLTPSDIDAILDQHQKYGMIRVEDVGKKLNTGRLCPLIASIDRPVPYEKIVAQIRANRAVLDEQGKQSREAAAIALNHQIEAHIEQNGMPDVLREMEFSIEEVDRAQPKDRQSRRDETGIARELAEQKPIGEGIRVNRDAPPSEGRRRPRVVLRGRRPRS